MSIFIVYTNIAFLVFILPDRRDRMAYQMTFQRYELKYLLNRQEKEQILLAMEPYMKLDDYGRTIIRNIYFDTDTFRLIRRSLEKPVYKEKLRIRSYKPVRATDPVLSLIHIYIFLFCLMRMEMLF